MWWFCIYSYMPKQINIWRDTTKILRTPCIRPYTWLSGLLWQKSRKQLGVLRIAVIILQNHIAPFLRKQIKSSKCRCVWSSIVKLNEFTRLEFNYISIVRFVLVNERSAWLCLIRDSSVYASFETIWSISLARAIVNFLLHKLGVKIILQQILLITGMCLYKAKVLYTLFTDQDIIPGKNPCDKIQSKKASLDKRDTICGKLFYH